MLATDIAVTKQVKQHTSGFSNATDVGAKATVSQSDLGGTNSLRRHVGFIRCPLQSVRTSQWTHLSAGLRRQFNIIICSSAKDCSCSQRTVL